MSEGVEYECEECGYSWMTEPPLFTIIHACEVQGCKGDAHPTSEGVSPSGIEEV